jgi:hypothetical protein
MVVSFFRPVRGTVNTKLSIRCSRLSAFNVPRLPNLIQTVLEPFFSARLCLMPSLRATGITGTHELDARACLDALHQQGITARHQQLAASFPLRLRCAGIKARPLAFAALLAAEHALLSIARPVCESRA